MIEKEISSRELEAVMNNLLNLTPTVFGPVPSRRLGKSLGINNIRPKSCTYSCVYCQLGKTTDHTIARQVFFHPCDILREVQKKIAIANQQNERIDYLTFVSDGEPTLDVNIGEEILLLKQIGIPIAVITNASMIWSNAVREDLLKADYVSLKVDAVDNDIWKLVNRPNKGLELNTILKSIIDFAETFKGTIVTETMLIGSIDYEAELEKIAAFLEKLEKLNRAYISVPIRPPTEKWVKVAKEEVVNSAFQIFSERLGVDRVECIVSYEGNAFAFTGDAEKDLLSIMSVHPMREEAVKAFLNKAKANRQIIEKLLAADKIVSVEYEGRQYYMQKFFERRLS